MKILLAAAIVASILAWTAATGLARNDAAQPRAAAKNHPPSFPKVKRTKTTTNFQYDDTGNLMGAVTTIKLLSKPVDPDHDRLKYAWKATNGTIRGKALTATWTRQCCADDAPAPGTVTLTVSDGHGGKAKAKFVFY